MNTLDYILQKYHLNFDKETQMPITIPNFGRNNLPQLFRELDFKIGAEIGVMAGKFSEALIRDNPRLKLFCVDPWQAHSDYLDESSQKVLDAYYQNAKTLLAPYNCELIRKYSLDAVKDFPEQSLDFVYLDGNHNLQNVINDISEWSKKIKTGGIISGHDYKLHKPSQHMHIYQAVNAYTDTHEIKPWFVLGRYNKKPDMIRDTSRSWMWIKS